MQTYESNAFCFPPNALRNWSLHLSNSSPNSSASCAFNSSWTTTSTPCQEAHHSPASCHRRRGRFRVEGWHVQVQQGESSSSSSGPPGGGRGLCRWWRKEVPASSSSTSLLAGRLIGFDSVASTSSGGVAVAVAVAVLLSPAAAAAAPGKAAAIDAEAEAATTVEVARVGGARGFPVKAARTCSSWFRLVACTVLKIRASNSEGCITIGAAATVVVVVVGALDSAAAAMAEEEEEEEEPVAAAVGGGAGLIDVEGEGPGDARAAGGGAGG